MKVTVFEKEANEGLHQSGRNSGVLHCGLYYQPGSLKAELSVQGIREMIAFAKEHQIAHDVCGKVVVATTDQEEKALDTLAQRGQKNGLSGLNYLSNAELKKREPFVRAQKALLVPEEGIIDYKGVMRVLIQKIKENNGTVYFQTPVNAINEETDKHVEISTKNGQQIFDYVVVCGGLWSDKTYSNLTKEKSPLKIVPFRGEYLSSKAVLKTA